MWLWSTLVLTVGSLGGAVALSPPAGATPAGTLTWLLFLGSSVHVAATAGLFSMAEVRAHAAQHRARDLVVPVAVVVTAGAVAGAASPAMITWGLLGYFAWQFWHYQKQNLGIAALAAVSSGAASPRRVERAALSVTAGSGIAALCARPSLLQLALGPLDPGLFALAGVAFTGGCLVGVVALLRRRPSQRPAAYGAAYLMALTFSLPIFAFRSPYAAVAGMTIAHGLQYLVLVGLVLRGSSTGRTAVTRLVAFGNGALIGALALSAASHLHNSVTLGRVVFGMYAGVVMVHFVVDAGLWRLRDAFPRALLRSRVPYLLAPPAAPTTPPRPSVVRLPI